MAEHGTGGTGQPQVPPNGSVTQGVSAPESRPVVIASATRSGAAPRRRVRRHMHDLWRRWRWRVIISVAVGAFVLGLIGYGHLYVNSGTLSPSPTNAHYPPVGWLDRIYYTILLFKFSTASGPPYSASLQYARWIAPLVTAY